MPRQTIEIIASAPAVTVDTAPFWEACDAGRLLLPRCRTCAHGAFYPPRLFCPRCGGRDLDWIESSGQGVLYAATTVRFAPFAQELEVPFTVCQVDLEEGVRMLSRYVGPESPSIGDEVEVRFARIRATDHQLPVFVSRRRS